ncbi:MAG: hypothetical protein WCF23_24765, partial [Candidatus Nitrosopolaris sp.]
MAVPDIVWWAMLSLFVQLTVPPTGIVTDFVSIAFWLVGLQASTFIVTVDFGCNRWARRMLLLLAMKSTKLNTNNSIFNNKKSTHYPIIITNT